jgi:hypothetical protein
MRVTIDKSEGRTPPWRDGNGRVDALVDHVFDGVVESTSAVVTQGVTFSRLVSISNKEGCRCPE